MPFDLKLVEAKLALGMIGPGEMPPLAWNALEAGLDGPSIRRMGALIQPSGWETDQILPGFLADAGMTTPSREEASRRVAANLAQRILTQNLDPLAFTRVFEVLWIQAEHPRSIQDAALLHDGKAVAEYISQSEDDFRQYAQEVLIALVEQSDPEL